MIYEAAGEAAAAEAAYREILSAGGPEAASARRRLAELLGGGARYEELLALLPVLQDADPAELWRWRAEAAEATGAPEQAVWDYGEAARRSDPMVAEELTARIRALLDGMDPAALEHLIAGCPFCPEGGYARLRQARLALATGQLDLAEPILDALLADFANDPIAAAAARHRAELTAQRAIQPGRYGLLLPLSGPLQVFGQRALRGALLASRLLTPAPEPSGVSSSGPAAPGDPARPGPEIHLAVFDTEGDPEVAARGVEELARQGVVGIVGPLKGAAASRAAEVARRLQVPLVTPTPVAEVSGEGVFRLYLREQDEVSRLVEFAVRVRGLRRFAVLFPDTLSGRRYRDLFWDAAVAEGAEITGVESYPAGVEGGAVGDAIERLTGVYGLTKAEIRERFEAEERIRVHRERDLLEALGIFDEEPAAPEPALAPEAPVAGEAAEARASLPPPGAVVEEQPLVIDAERLAAYRPAPVVDFDAVFLPTSGLEAAQLAPQFPFRDVEGVVLLGIRSWNYPTLVEVGDEYVEGALFPAELYPGLAAAREFFAAYRRLYGEDPGVIDAYAFDAVHLLLTQGAEQPLDTTRPALARRLWAVWAADGVTGPLTTHPSGDIAAAPKILTVRRGRLVSAE
ncbi:MAG: penicillin-binding protein activator [Deferrisomatales bacterium]|nr:penicillin-binding protein activator [Deferrisomatales bacterium]